MDLHADAVESPIGPIHVVSGGAEAICALDFGEPDERLLRLLRARFGPGARLAARRDPLGACSRLRAYLAGDLAALDDLPVDLGGTPFQARVWAALRTIPAGTTLSYRGLAERIGAPGAVRAVGLANGRNPVSIVVPCHRVIGADGSLTGYGGGLPRKRWLLEHEGVLPRGMGF